MKSDVDVFHKRDTPFGKVRDELLQRVIVQTGSREGYNVNVQIEFAGDALNERGLSGSGSSILQKGVRGAPENGECNHVKKRFWRGGGRRGRWGGDG